MTTKLRLWAPETSASENATAGGLNFAENQLPSTVNNSVRSMMGQLRDWYDPNEVAWVEWSATCSVASQTTLKLVGDQTAHLPQGRRLRFRGGSAVRYATLLSASFTAETTLTIEDATGSLSASTSVVGFAMIPLAMPRRVDKLDVSGTLSVGVLAGSANTFAINVLNAGSISVSAGILVSGVSTLNIVNVASLSVSANVVIAGTLTVAGTATVSGNARFSTNLDVSATASAAVVNAPIGNIAVANVGSLSVSAAAVFKAGIDVSATASVGLLNVLGNTSISGGANIIGNVTMRGNLGVSGTASAAVGDFAVGNIGSLSVSAAAVISGGLTVGGTATVSGNARFSTNLDVSATASAAVVNTPIGNIAVANVGSLSVSAAAVFKSTVGVSATLSAGVANIGSLSVSAATVLGGTLTVAGAATISGNARFSTNLDVSATISAAFFLASYNFRAIDPDAANGIGFEAVTNSSGTSFKSSALAATSVALTARMYANAYAGSIVKLDVSATASTTFNFIRTTSDSFSDVKHNLRGDGTGLCDVSWTGGGADFAELREWLDGNASATDRAGVSVVLTDGKITLAKAGDDPIGVVSVAPTVIGGNRLNWPGKYVTDDFGREKRDVEGHRILNPAYDPDREYVTRDLRPEWAAIGLVGFVPVRNDQVVSPRWVKSRVISDAVTEYLIR